jgi:iron complex transport system substrate-binding protein
MSRLDALNLAALVLALLIAGIATVRVARPGGVAAQSALEASGRVPTVTLPDGRTAVRDAHGTPIPLGTYTRIASLGRESDALLSELCGRDRLVAGSTYPRGTVALRLAGLPRVPGLDDLEAVIRLAPDLVFVSSGADQLDRIARLREAGLTVCDLGSQRGLTSLVPNARLVGALIGANERAEHFVSSFTGRLANVAARLPSDAPRRRALYLGVYGRDLYGGGSGTSYHDLLTAAGLRDAADGHFSGWPKLAIEDVIAIDPDVLVLSSGSAAALRTLPGANAIRAVVDGGLLILDDEVLEDPALGLLDAAEALFRLAYPPVTPLRAP